MKNLNFLFFIAIPEDKVTTTTTTAPPPATVAPNAGTTFKLNRWTVGVTTAVAIVATIATHVFG